MICPNIEWINKYDTKCIKTNININVKMLIKNK